MEIERTGRLGAGRRIVAAAVALLALGGLVAATAHAFSKKKALSLFYTKDESDARYLQQSTADGLYAAKSDVYTKSEADGKFAASTDVYSKAAADAQFAAAADVYTKSESDARFAVSIWASVAANGSLIRGNNTAPGSGKTGTGQYEVKFNQPINGCAKAVTLYGASFGEVTVLDHGTDAAKVVVFTADSSGAPADRQFHLIVMC